jgi:hypothetical protein
MYLPRLGTFIFLDCQTFQTTATGCGKRAAELRSLSDYLLSFF